MKKALSIVLSAVLLISCFSVTLASYAVGGVGTESNPYTISTATELRNINNNVSASYKLVADIDLSGMDFTPIGNADSGAFSGTFDGNGYTISNLNVYAGKFSGLFGCNEGTIENVTLSNVDVYGTKFVGGVVGQNTELGLIKNCKVLSGEIYSENVINKLYTGGICGQNNGDIEGVFVNNSNITINSNSIGYYYTGGIIGYCKKDSFIVGTNNGNITGNCLFSDTAHYSYDGSGYSPKYIFYGGIVGYGANALFINNSVNNGVVFCYHGSNTCIGGLVGCAKNATIQCSYNSGFIQTEVYSGSSEAWVGGLIGATGTQKNDYSQSINIINSYNSGNIYSKSDCNIASFTSCEKGNQSFINSYNIGNYDHDGSANIGSLGYWDAKETNCYITNEQHLESTGHSLALPYGKYHEKTSYNTWDFEKCWDINLNLNSGFPILKENSFGLILNETSKTMASGDTIQLVAYKNGTIVNDVDWQVTYGSGSVTKNGLFVAVGTGMSTVTATDQFGNKTNFNAYVVNKASSISSTITDSCEVGKEKTYYIGFNDFIVDASVADESIASAYVYNNYGIMVKGIKGGSTKVYYKTLQGFEGSFTVNVTLEVASSFSVDSYKTVTRGQSAQINSKFTPEETSSYISNWKSSDESIATVDSNGNVTGVNIGTAYITATTDNGRTSTCKVSVVAPVETMEFEEANITMYKGDSKQLHVITNPSDTTDSINYSSSSNSSCSVDYYTGIVTAKYTGTYTITARASSGVTAYCTIRLIDIPIVVTNVSLNETEHQMYVGEMYKLTETIYPSNATDKSISWTTTNSTVATVGESGMVTAVGAGTVTINATASNGASAACRITVLDVNSVSCIHDWVLKSRIEASCTQTGEEVYKCNLCNDTRTDILPIVEHTYVIAEQVDATPNSQGYTRYVCPICNHAYVGDITPFASDSSTLEAVIEEAHYYSKSKFSAEQIKSIIDEAESYRELSKTNAPQDEYDYAVGEILTTIQSVDALATYMPVSIEGDTVTLENEHGEEREVSFEEAINEYEAPLDVVKDGIINAKDFAYLIKHYSD